jgi:hypothetical protein
VCRIAITDADTDTAELRDSNLARLMRISENWDIIQLKTKLDKDLRGNTLIQILK